MDAIQTPIDFLSNHPEIKTISAPAGTEICNVGDTCKQMLILQEGLVHVYRTDSSGRSVSLYHISSGESCILTASCIINDKPFPAIAVTEQDSVAYAIPMNLMMSWFKSEPVWQNYLFNLISNRMSDLIGLVDALAFRNLDGRLAIWLLDHSKSNPEIQMTHQEIAEQLASSREVISRLLKEFERDGFVELNRGKITVIKPDKLQSIR